MPVWKRTALSECIRFFLTTLSTKKDRLTILLTYCSQPQHRIPYPVLYLRRRHLKHQKEIRKLCEDVQMGFRGRYFIQLDHGTGIITVLVEDEQLQIFGDSSESPKRFTTATHKCAERSPHINVHA